MDKKQIIPVSTDLLKYLKNYGRRVELPVHYNDLIRFVAGTALLDQDDNDTLWQTVYYAQNDQEDLFDGLKKTYALLRMDGNFTALPHLEVARIDYCLFGNTRPFRIRIINRLNDNYDHFYVKQADASRIYGLELEELLSPNSVLYLLDGETLIEEHIAGIPGDDFFERELDVDPLNQIRIAKEFIKFNERCFVRLLGDMRAYNYVVDITPDIEGNQYRIRAIDFDQQSYEGRKNFYLPQYFKDNNPIIFIGMKLLEAPTVKQYQLEERSMIAARIKASSSRIYKLMQVMDKDSISKPEFIAQLSRELGEHHHSRKFKNLNTMGKVLRMHLQLLLEKEFTQSTDILMEGKG
ncbi:MAG: hypothetical protein AAF741_00910 [Bacteroidota bacterium]